MSERLKIVERWLAIDPIFQEYFGEATDLSKAPAILLEQRSGQEPIYRTLDGSRVRPLREVADSREEFEELKKQLEKGEIDGLNLSEWFVRVKEDS